MAESLDIPLPELSVDNFKRAWTRFELVARAKGWDAAKQLVVLPTLLRGKFVDTYMDFNDETKADLAKLKAALEKATGRVEDPLAAAKLFVSRDQGANERVEDFAAALKKLFKQAYPSEDVKSSVLLQRFLTGLRAPISRQLLLRKKPTELAEAIDNATEIEYALSFNGTQEPKEVNLVHPAATREPGEDQLRKLQETLDAMTQRMKALESALTAQATGTTPRDTDTHGGSSGANRRTGAAYRGRGRNSRSRLCFLCGQEGHIQRNCPSTLNYAGPARMAGGWSGRY